MLLTSIDSLKKRLWISSDEYNTELSSIIERATKIIETEIWDISEKNIIERVDSFWNKKIYEGSLPPSYSRYPRSSRLRRLRKCGGG